MEWQELQFFRKTQLQPVEQFKVSEEAGEGPPPGSLHLFSGTVQGVGPTEHREGQRRAGGHPDEEWGTREKSEACDWEMNRCSKGKPEGLSLDLRQSCKKPGQVAHPCNPSSGEAGTGESPELASQPVWSNQ